MSFIVQKLYTNVLYYPYSDHCAAAAVRHIQGVETCTWRRDATASLDIIIYLQN